MKKLQNLYVASFSGGKDSLAMVLKLISTEYPLDVVLFYDTGKEFDCIYRIAEKVAELCKAHGIQFAHLKSEQSFDYLAFEKPIQCRNGSCKKGYSWCGGSCRWATSKKLEAIQAYYNSLPENVVVVEYVGIAADEVERIEEVRKKRFDGKIKLYPLIEWNMTEAQCKQYCYVEGYDWKVDEGMGEVDLYQILKRVSCWCCGNKNLEELKNIFRYLPKTWEKLKEMQRRTCIPFYIGKWTIFDLEERFKVEGMRYNLFDFAEENNIEL